jgi:putative copper export protein
VSLHVLAAAVWLGGMLFLALVVVPVTRGLGMVPQQREALFQAVGQRFRIVGWASLAVLLVTGALNLWYRGVDPLSPALLASPFGRVLIAKLLAVVAMVGATVYHDLSGARAAARLGTLLGVLVVLLAVLLVRPPT